MSNFYDHFSGHAELYSRYRPAYPDTLFAWLASQSMAHERALDCAAGNGQAAVGLAPHFQHVVALDASREQLGHAPETQGITYVGGAAEAMPLADQCMDVVVVAQALHWLDHSSFYAEVRRVARPGAVVAAWMYELFSIDPEVDDVLIPFHSETLEPHWPPQRIHVMNRYEDIPFPFEPLEAPALSLHPRWTRRDVLNQISTWSAVRRHDAATGQSAVELLAPKLAEVWPDEAEQRELDWRITIRAGRVQGRD